MCEFGVGPVCGVGLGILTLGVVLCSFGILEGVGICGGRLAVSLLGLMCRLHACVMKWICEVRSYLPFWAGFLIQIDCLKMRNSLSRPCLTGSKGQCAGPVHHKYIVRTNLANRPTEPMLVSFETRYTKLRGNRGCLRSGSRQTTPVCVGVTCGFGMSVVRVGRI